MSQKGDDQETEYFFLLLNIFSHHLSNEFIIGAVLLFTHFPFHFTCLH